MASGAFTTGIEKIQNQTLSWTGLDYKVMLMQSTYTYNPDQDFVSDISANEVSAVGYSRSANLAGKTVSEDAGNNRVTLDATDPAAFGPIAAGQTIAGAVVFYDTGVAGTSQLLCYEEFSAAVPTNGGTVTVPFNALGVLYYQI